MNTTTLTLSLALLVACAETPEPESESPAPTEGELNAARATSSLDSAVADATTVANAISVAFEPTEVGDFAQDGELTSLIADFSACADVSLEDTVLTVEFLTCDQVSGTLRLDVPRFGPTTLTFEDDFAVDGRDVDGMLTFDAVFVDRRFTLSGSVTLEGVDVDVAVDLDAFQGFELWGSFAVDDGSREFSVTAGSEAEPMSWTRGCLCATSGTIAAEGVGTVESITLDYDDLVAPLDGEDDFPPFDVPVSPTPVTASIEVDYSGGCGMVDSTVTAADVMVTIANSDLEAPLVAACDAGEVDADDCERALRLIGNLSENITIFVPVSTVADSLETELDAILAEVCGEI